MFRISTILCFAMFLLGAFGLYQVKYEVLDLREEVDLLETELAEERDALHVVKAEWAYLNRPERLRRLAGKYLEMEPMSGAQLADLSGLPYENGLYTVAEEGGAPSYLVPVRNSQ